MQIQIEHDGTHTITTFAAFLEALAVVSSCDDEMEAVLNRMVDEDRIHFLDAHELAA